MLSRLPTFTSPTSIHQQRPVTHHPPNDGIAPPPCASHSTLVNCAPTNATFSSRQLRSIDVRFILDLVQRSWRQSLPSFRARCPRHSTLELLLMPKWDQPESSLYSRLPPARVHLTLQHSAFSTLDEIGKIEVLIQRRPLTASFPISLRRPHCALQFPRL